MKTNKKFYIEYWKRGDKAKNVAASTFHHNNIKTFITTFMQAGYYVVHLEVIEPYRKVIYTTRPVQHNKAA